MPTYLGSPKHCEPITAQRPGIKCPKWSRAIAQELLDQSEPMGEKRVATRDGVAFVAQLTHTDRDIGHGYPEAWDNVDPTIRKKWLDEGRIKSRDVRTFNTVIKLRDKFGGKV